MHKTKRRTKIHVTKVCKVGDAQTNPQAQTTKIEIEE